jgi:hypothetical protein
LTLPRSCPCIAEAAASRTLHVRLVMSENGRNIVPPDRVRPGFEEGFDPGLFGVGVLRHGFGSFVHSEDEQRARIRHARAVVRLGRRKKDGPKDRFRR